MDKQIESKEINQAEGNFALAVGCAPTGFCRAKLVVSVNENRDNRIQRLDFSRKTPAAARQNRNVTPQIGVHSLDRERIFLVAEILRIFALIHDVFVTTPTVRKILFAHGAESTIA